MKPLLVLISISLLSFLILKFITGSNNFLLSARIGMSVMLVFTALGHFIFTDGMALMVPDFLPFKKEWVYLTALLEIAAAIGLHIPQFRLLTGWLLLVFFVLMLPANIKAAMDHLDYQNASYTGMGMQYLWFRVPLQVLFVAWVYLSSIRIW